MRWRFRKRPELVPAATPEPASAHPAFPLIHDLLTEGRIFRLGRETILRGRLRYDGPDALARVEAALEGLDVAWFSESVDGGTRVTVVHPAPPTVPREWPWNALLLVATILSTLWAGAALEGMPWLEILDDPARLADGLPFAASLLGILAAHEMGHYVAARRYRLNVSLPFFVPLPLLSPIGTLGAVIKMRTPIYTRRMLLDVGAAGPLAGLVVAIPVAIAGVLSSPVLAVEPGAGITLGEPLLYQAIAAGLGPPIPAGHDLYLDAVAFAGWLGLFVTALNLLPLGQLDGGHVLYALVGKWQHRLGWPFLGALVAMGWWWPGWWVWALLVLVLIRVRHPPVLDDEPLDPRRRAVGWLAVLAFAVCFTPVPFDLL